MCPKLKINAFLVAQKRSRHVSITFICNIEQVLVSCDAVPVSLFSYMLFSFSVIFYNVICGTIFSAMQHLLVAQCNLFLALFITLTVLRL